jgi:hypothetical protein
MFLDKCLQLEQMYKIENENDMMEYELAKQRVQTKTVEMKRKTTEIQHVLDQKTLVLRKIYERLQDYEIVMEGPVGEEMSLSDQRDLYNSLCDIQSIMTVLNK